MSIFLFLRPVQTSRIFPYTTLFRSLAGEAQRLVADGHIEDALSLLGQRMNERAVSLEVHALYRSLLSQGNDRPALIEDRKSTRLNSSHVASSYAVFCLKKKNCRDHA